MVMVRVRVRVPVRVRLRVRVRVRVRPLVRKRATLRQRLLPWCWIISAILIGPGHANIMLGWCIVLTYIIILFII